jgi:hypothetical protein
VLSPGKGGEATTETQLVIAPLLAAQAGAAKTHRHSPPVLPPNAAETHRQVLSRLTDEATEMTGFPEQAAVTFQQDTAVIAGFRGHGLGRAMRAVMMRMLATERPRLERVETTTAADNNYMIKVNHELGYVTTRSVATMEAAISEVRSRLAATVDKR